MVASAAPAAAQTAAFQVGVVPNVSARVIVTTYQPMRAYLERELAQAVEIGTAPDFRSFYQRHVTNTYDLVVSPANLAMVAEDAGQPAAVAIYEPGIPALLVMVQARPVRDLADLRGKTLALSNPTSLVALRTLGWLAEQGIRPGQDVTLVHARNDDSLGQLLMSGEAPLALMSGGEFRAIRDDLRASLQVYREVMRVPGFFVLPGKASVDSARLARLMTQFPTSPEGQEFLRLSGFQGIRAITEADRAQVRSVVDETRRLLTQP
jgi:phosphonate transport system substrate-binding protein